MCYVTEAYKWLCYSRYYCTYICQNSKNDASKQLLYVTDGEWGFADIVATKFTERDRNLASFISFLFFAIHPDMASSIDECLNAGAARQRMSVVVCEVIFSFSFSYRFPSVS